jgi:hypothetical protein
MYRMIELPDDRRGRIWQRLHSEVFVFAAAYRFSAELLSDFLGVIFGTALAIALRAIRKRDPKTLHFALTMFPSRTASPREISQLTTAQLNSRFPNPHMRPRLISGDLASAARQMAPDLMYVTS